MRRTTATTSRPTAGCWAPTWAANYTVSYESDGSAIFDHGSNTDFSLKFSAAELDVSGKPIKDFLGYESHQLIAESIAGTPVFSSGAKIYQVNFIVKNDTYELSNWFDCDEGSYTDADGNCNVVWGAVAGRPAFTFAELLYPAGAPPVGNSFSVGDGIADPAGGGRWRPHQGQDRSPGLRWCPSIRARGNTEPCMANRSS